MTRYRFPTIVLFTVAAFVAAVVWTQPGSAQRRQNRRPVKEQTNKPAPKQLARLDGFSDWVTSVAFSPDGKQLATGTYEAVKVWDAVSKRSVKTFKIKGYAKALAYSPDGRLLVAGGYQSVNIWETESYKKVRSLKGHRGYVTGVTFSPDSTALAISSEDESIRVWNVETGEKLRVIRGHAYPVMDVAFSPDGRLLASVAGDETRVTKPGEVKIWDADTGKELFNLVGHEKAATSVAFSPDGKYLASTGEDEKVNVHDVQTGQPLGYFAGHGRPTNSVIFATDSKTLISGAGGRAQGKNEIKIWDRASGDERTSIAGHTGQVACIALSPDGKTLASGSYDKTVALWDVGPFLQTPSLALAALVDTQPIEGPVPAVKSAAKQLRAGIIGLDTSHVIAFTKILNDENAAADVSGCRVVAAYPQGSPDIVSSTIRVPQYTEQMKELGVEIVDSIPALLEKVDVVLLETNDGRPHLEQVIPVLQSGKPVFIDKPIAGSLADAVAIFELARRHNVPLFSSSSLRYGAGAQALRNGKLGEILGCDAYSPCSLEKTHPDLFWYGIHGVETLFTVMGTGCQSVTRASSPGLDVVVGTWQGGRIGTFRGIRKGRRGYGGTAFGSKGITPIGASGGYRPLLVEIVKFFRTGNVPVSEQETLEIYAFMEAADESKRQAGQPVTLESVLKKARVEAAEKLAKLK